MKKWLIPAVVVCAVVLVVILMPSKRADLTAYGVRSWSHYRSPEGFGIDYPTGWKARPYDTTVGRGVRFSSPQAGASIVVARSDVPRYLLESMMERCGSELSAVDQCLAQAIVKDSRRPDPGVAADTVVSGRPAKEALFEYAEPGRLNQAYRITTLGPDGSQFCILVSLPPGDVASLEALKDKVAEGFRFTGTRKASSRAGKGVSEDAGGTSR